MKRTAKHRALRICAIPLALWVLEASPVDAGAWTLPAGRVWTKVSWFQQTTDEWYIDVPEPLLLDDGTFGAHPVGTRRPYRFDGEYDSRALFIEGFIGLTDWLDVGFQVPYFDQVFDDAQVKHREMKLEMPRPGIQDGKVDLIANPIKFSETRVEYRVPPPTLGEHTDEVLGELLDFAPDEMAALRERGVI